MSGGVHMCWTASRIYQLEIPGDFDFSSVSLWDDCVDTFTKARYPDSTLATRFKLGGQSGQVIVSPLTSIASKDSKVIYTPDGQDPSAALSTASKVCVRVGFLRAVRIRKEMPGRHACRISSATRAEGNTGTRVYSWSCMCLNPRRPRSFVPLRNT